jgi:hypothetical protein
MKKTALLLLLILLAVPAFAQVSFVPVTVSFAHIDVGGDPNGLNYVMLLQVVNNNSATVNGHVNLFADSGSALSASFDGGTPQSSLDFSLESGAIRQIQISLSGGITSGWMQIGYTPNNAQTTVILQYRSGNSVLSEVGVNPDTGQNSQSCIWTCGTDFSGETDITNGLNTGIAVVNPTSAAAYALVTLSDPSTGNKLASTTLTLAANAHVAKLMTELFQSTANIGQMRAQVSIDSCSSSACTAAGSVGFIATALRLNGNLFTTLPVVQRGATSSSVRYVPHVAFGGDPGGLNFKTVLYLTTPLNAGTGLSGVVDLFDDNGNAISASANGAIPSSHFAFTVLGHTVSRIVLSGGANLQAGWARITLTNASPMVVNAVFQTYTGSTLSSEAGVLESIADTESLIYVNVQSGVTNLGVALSNPQPAASTATLTLYNSAGFVADTQVVTLPAFGHLAQYVTSIFPSLASASSFSGSLSIQSNLSISAVALRQNGSNVVGFAALPVADNLMFLPSITNVQVTSTARSPGVVNFSISVTDYTPNLVTTTSTAVATGVGLFYPSQNQFDGYYSLLLDGTALLNAASGTMTGTLNLTYNIPSGTTATFYVYVVDTLGNPSNLVKVPIKF